MRNFLILLCLMITSNYYSQGTGDIINNTSNDVLVQWVYIDTASCIINPTGGFVSVGPNSSALGALTAPSAGEYLAHLTVTDINTSAFVSLWHTLGYCASANMSATLSGFQWGGTAIWNYAPGSGPPNKPYDLTLVP